MKAIIPILKATIRPNPTYGQHTIAILGPKTFWFELTCAPIEWWDRGKIRIPSPFFVDGVTFAVQKYEEGVNANQVFVLNAYCIAINSQIPEALVSGKIPEKINRYLSWGMEQELTHILNPQMHMRFLYEYDETEPVECSCCGKTVPLKNMREAEVLNGGDRYNVDQCPHCHAIDSFYYEYEQLNY